MQETPPAQRPARWTPSLIRHLLERVVLLRRGPQQRLPPPGERSGHGLESIAPYLKNSRDTRPGPLE